MLTSKFVHGAYTIISNQMADMKMTVSIGSVNLCTTSTTDEDISS